MAITDIWEIRIVYDNTVTNERLTNRLRARQNSIADPTLSAIGDDVKDWWNTDLTGGLAQKKRHSANIRLVQVELQKIKPESATILTYTTGLPIVGTDASETGRPQDCMLLSLRTAKSGRSYRGRVYLPTPSEDVTASDGNLGTGTAQDLVDQFTTFIATLVVDGLTPVVFSRQHDGAAVDEANDITLVKCDTKLRTQRRRTNRAPAYN